MVSYDGAAKIAALFLQGMFNFQYLGCLNAVLNSYVLYVAYPQINRVGRCQRQLIAVETRDVRVDIAVVEYRIALLPFTRIAGVVYHKHTVIYRWRRHGQLVKADGGGEVKGEG